MKKSKIDWEVFEGSSSGEEAMYYFLFGKYGFNGFEQACTFIDSDNNDAEEYLDEDYEELFKQMRKMGTKAARQDCKDWLITIYGPDAYSEILSDYCTCDHCPIHGKDIE